jgi:hypothetical protein
MWKGSIADFPTPPMKINIIAHVITDKPINTAPPVCVIAAPDKLVRAAKSKVSVLNDRISIPIKKNKSANRVTINAFFAALTADGFV